MLTFPFQDEKFIEILRELNKVENMVPMMNQGPQDDANVKVNDAQRNDDGSLGENFETNDSR